MLTLIRSDSLQMKIFISILGKMWVKTHRQKQKINSSAFNVRFWVTYIRDKKKEGINFFFILIKYFQAKIYTFQVPCLFFFSIVNNLVFINLTNSEVLSFWMVKVEARNTTCWSHGTTFS